jgi:hypothetical protein
VSLSKKVFIASCDGKRGRVVTQSPPKKPIKIVVAVDLCSIVDFVDQLIVGRLGKRW